MEDAPGPPASQLPVTASHDNDLDLEALQIHQMLLQSYHESNSASVSWFIHTPFLLHVFSVFLSLFVSGIFLVPFDVPNHFESVSHTFLPVFTLTLRRSFSLSLRFCVERSNSFLDNSIVLFSFPLLFLSAFAF